MATSKLGVGKLGQIVLGTLGASSSSLYAHAQAQATILTTQRKFAQAQGTILATSRIYAQAQGSILQVYSTFAQAQADILVLTSVYSQANADIKAVNAGFAQAQTKLNSFNVPVFAQAQANIAFTGNIAVAQAQASITQIYKGYAQAQSSILATIQAYAQAQSSILATIQAYAQAQSSILATNRGFAQSQTSLLQIYRSSAQAQADINTTTSRYAQTPAKIIKYTILLKDTFSRVQGLGTLGTPDIGPAYAIESDWLNYISVDGSQAVLASADYVFAVSHLDIVNTESSIEFKSTSIQNNSYLVELDFRRDPIMGGLYTGIYFNGSTFEFYMWSGTTNTAPTTTPILPNTWYVFKAEVIGSIFRAKIYEKGTPEPNWEVTLTDAIERAGSVAFYADLGTFDNPPSTTYFDNYNVFQSLAPTSQIYAQAQAHIVKRDLNKHAQARASIKQTYNGSAQARAFIIKLAFAQAQAYMIAYKTKIYGLAQAKINQSAVTRTGQARALIYHAVGCAQVQAQIISNPTRFAQSQGFIRKLVGFGQAQAQLSSSGLTRFAQARASIDHLKGVSQAQALIRPVRVSTGQTRATIKVFGYIQTGQARAYITSTWAFAQARALIGNRAVAQAAAKILSFGTRGVGQAQGYIGGKYLVRFNNMDLPGYAQEEDFNSGIEITRNYAAYEDGASEGISGLTNKVISVRMKVIGDTYASVKDQVQKAATIVRTSRDYAKLNIQSADKYYLAIAKSITTSKTVKESSRMLDYSLEFEAKPWLYSEQIHTLSGTALITAARTINNGGWTPTRVTLTGTNVTVSGYSNTEPYTGFISVSGAVTDLRIDAERYTATINGINANSTMNTRDYRLYVAPETTYFAVTGATECIIEYEDRYYL